MFIILFDVRVNVSQYLTVLAVIYIGYLCCTGYDKKKNCITVYNWGGSLLVQMLRVFCWKSKRSIMKWFGHEYEWVENEKGGCRMYESQLESRERLIGKVGTLYIQNSWSRATCLILLEWKWIEHIDHHLHVKIN